MKKTTYESAIKRLGEIVNLLERQNVSLDESLALFEEGVKLIAYCHDCISSAEQKITELSELNTEEERK